MDHLTALRVFRQVVEQGGFAAARQLGLSPAAVSKNIAELEAHVAARLLNRTTRRMSLTEAGTRYYEQVARILDELREAEQSLGPLQSAPTGTLRVSAPMSFTLTRLSAAIPAFLARHPDLSLDLNRRTGAWTSSRKATTWRYAARTGWRIPVWWRAG